MKQIPPNRLCVYCGSNAGANAIFLEHAKQLGRTMADAGLGLVYGGGGGGLMGAVARSVKTANGHVTSVIPTALLGAQDMFDEVDERHVVSDYHGRKRRMVDLSDGFVALPGGPGTLEELSEQLAWAAGGFHAKPIFIVNSHGFWGRFLDLLQTMQREGFMGREITARYIVVNEPEQLVSLFLAGRRNAGAASD